MTRLVILVLLASLALQTSSMAEDQDGFQHFWGGFATSLVVRTKEQRQNATIAAKEIDGLIIPPGGVFSFNDLVGGREASKGYAKAPFLDSKGILNDTPGGGICQLASTIYNAGLLAGMQVIERHPHSRPVGHVPPGRDATISSWRKDLKLKNISAHPLLLSISLTQNRLASSFKSTVPKPFTAEIKTEQVKITPETIIHKQEKQPLSQQGAHGYSTVTRRVLVENGATTDELISEDFYPAASRLIGARP